MKNELLALAQEFIRAGNGPDSNARIQDRINDLLQEVAAERISVEAAKTQHSTWLLGEQGPLFVLSGHTDVVAPGDTAAWTHPPFAAECVDGRLHGRGAVDMRAALAAVLLAVTRSWNSVRGRIRLAIAISGDEETSAKGTPALIAALQQHGERAAACLVAEPSSLERSGDKMRIGRRGSLSATARFQGALGHTAYVSAEDNVLHEAMSVATRITEIVWPKDPEPWPPVNFHITNFSSGTGENNVVPPSAEFSFNVRYGPSLRREDVIKRCESCFQQSNVPYAIEWKEGCAPYYTDSSKLTEVIAKAVKSVTGRAPLLAVDGGTSDGRFFANAGIPTVELGTPARSLHEVNEAIELSELELLCDLYCASLEALAAAAEQFEAAS